MAMPSGVEQALDAYNVSRESQDRLRVYVALLLTWQRQINLIGPATIPLVWTRHVLDALQIIPLLPPGCERIADLGSGAGFPGLAISLASGIETHLYESNKKKCAFLQEVIRKTRARATVHCGRLESIKAPPGGVPIDCVLSRALAPLGQLLEYAEPFFSPGTVALFHKGRDVDLELTEATKYWRFTYTKHSSASDSLGVILEMREVHRV